MSLTLNLNLHIYLAILSFVRVHVRYTHILKNPFQRKSKSKSNYVGLGMHLCSNSSDWSSKCIMSCSSLRLEFVDDFFKSEPSRMFSRSPLLLSYAYLIPVYVKVYLCGQPDSISTHLPIKEDCTCTVYLSVTHVPEYIRYITCAHQYLISQFTFFSPKRTHAAHTCRYACTVLVLEAQTGLY